MKTENKKTTEKKIVATKKTKKKKGIPFSKILETIEYAKKHPVQFVEGW